MSRSGHRQPFQLAHLLLCLAAAGAGPLPAEETKEKARPEIYDTKADAKKLIESALARAKRGQKRVLLVFGGNWCGWCHKLHETLKKEDDLARLVRFEYEVVMVDVGNFDKHLDVAASCGAEIKQKGVPYLTVLGADGKALVNQNTGDLEDGPRHDVAKLKSFLEKWKAEPLDAEKVLREALSLAGGQKKSVLVHLGAPT